MEESEEMDMEMPFADDKAEKDDAERDMADDDGEEAGEEELEDRVMDLESALDDLKAEFDALMADEAGEPEHNDGVNDPIMGGEEEGMGEMAFEAEEKVDEEEEVDESADEELARLREYVEKIGAPNNTEAGDGKAGPVPGKNDMGGKAVKFDAGGDENGRPAPKAQTMATGNRNVPGGKADSLEAAPKAKTGE
jgi:hypothetical protein